MPPRAWLLRQVSLMDGQLCDVRVAGGQIVEMAPRISATDVAVVEAGGRALLPGLRDHHLHLMASAARRDSLDCSALQDRAELERALREARPNAQGWIRALGYHPALHGALDRAQLDRWVPAHPLRLQHASGRMWWMNSAALARLGDDGPWEREQGVNTGRLLDADAWLDSRLPRLQPDLASLSAELASHGVVAVTDTGPRNDLALLAEMRQARREGLLRQALQLMGDASLDGAYGQPAESGVQVGPRKIHLLESELPALDALCASLHSSRAVGRPLAFHCVSRVELHFALAVLDELGGRAGDRIEHLGVCGPEELALMRGRPLCVVSQPGFILDRGDRYLRDVEAADQGDLYRLRSVLEAGLPLAGSSDAPFGPLNPWLGMQAAVDRRSRQGQRIGKGEALGPEQALALYTGPLDRPGRPAPPLAIGQSADLCLIDGPWAAARQRLGEVRVLFCLRRGEPIWRVPELDGDA